MTSKFLKDLRCPQFVDFLDGMDSNSESPFFDCNDQTPQNRNTVKSSPVPERGLTEDDENKLMNSMTAALSFIESTPKLKKNIFKEKLFAAKAPLNPIDLLEIKPSTKARNLQMLPTRIRSKTVARLDKICAGKVNKAKDFKTKRSSSLSDLRTIKKHTLPRTPLCLKRTIDAKAKAKAIKTTEEMELEQITELQKQLSKMLRQNEIAYRKLNSKQRPILPKNPETKPETSKGNTCMNADKNSRWGFKSTSHTSIKKVLKLDSIINGNFSKGVSSKAYTTCTVDPAKKLERLKPPSVSSSIVSEEGEKTLSHFPKKPATVDSTKGLERLKLRSVSSSSEEGEKALPLFPKKSATVDSTKDLERSKIRSVSSSILSEEGEKTLPLFPKKSANIGFHSGVLFCDSNKKSTVPKPFTFETRMKQKKVHSTATDENSEVMNIKPLTSRKTIAGSNRNTARGFPLSENGNRN